MPAWPVGQGMREEGKKGMVDEWNEGLWENRKSGMVEECPPGKSDGE